MSDQTPEVLRRVAKQLENVDWSGGSCGVAIIEDAADEMDRLNSQLVVEREMRDRMAKAATDVNEQLESQLRTALKDTERLDVLQAAIASDGLYVDAEAWPPISLYPVGSEEAIVEYNLRDVADAILALPSPPATNSHE